MNAEILSPSEERILKKIYSIRSCTSYFRKFQLNIIFLTQAVSSKKFHFFEIFVYNSGCNDHNPTILTIYQLYTQILVL